MSRRGLILLMMILMSLVVSSVTFDCSAAPRTLRVPLDFTTIQGAIDNAEFGDTVFVYNGTYHERILVSKVLTITGQNSEITTIDGDGLGTTINITASEVSISGFTITGGGPTQADCGVNIDFVSNCSIFANNIISNSVGVLLNNATGNILYHNNFADNELHVGVAAADYFNTWDNGYPSGGNHWNNHTGPDVKKGASQDQPGNDGIVDSPYFIDTYNIDHYPFVDNWRPRIVKNLNTGLTYETIQEAIDDTATINGNTVLVYAGIFYENVIVDKTVHLRGENISGTIVDAGGAGSAIHVTSSGVSIANLTMRNSGSLSLDSGVLVRNSLSVNIMNNIMSNNYNGILLDNSNSCQIESNNILNNRFGVDLHYSKDNHAGSNNIDMTVDYGISIRYSNSNIVEQNTIRNAREGVRIENSYNNKVDRNNLINYYDVHVLYSKRNKLSGNILSGNFAGFSVELSSENLIAGNNITAHRIGLSLRESLNNTIYYNNFVGNAFQAFVDSQGYINNWNMSYPLGGNYWSDYAGVDAKSGPSQDQPGSDGIGDTPYTINSENKDNYPLVLVVSPTAAVDIHDVAIENVTVPQKVAEGGSLNITVFAANRGNYTENFGVSVYSNATIIETKLLSQVPPRKKLNLTYVWNTVGVPANSTCVIKASASSVPGEENLVNNQYGGILVSVLFYRDVAVSNSAISSAQPYQGTLVNITTLASNLGYIPETFTVRVFRDEISIDNRTVNSLNAHSNMSLTFVWNTSGVALYNNYTIIVKVDPVPDEAILGNNNDTAGQVRMRIFGDTNGDQTVNILDLAAIASAFLCKVGDPKYRSFLDLNADGQINIIDISIAARNFGRAYP